MKDRWKLREFDERIRRIVEGRKTETVITDGTDMKQLITIIRSIQSTERVVNILVKYTHSYVAYHKTILDAIEFECLNGICVTYLYPGDYQNQTFVEKFEPILEHTNLIVRRSQLDDKEIDNIIQNYRFLMLIDYKYLIVITNAFIEFKVLTDTAKYNKIFKFK